MRKNNTPESRNTHLSSLSVKYMKKLILGLLHVWLLMLLFPTSAAAQKMEKVRAEYTYYAPENITVEEAKRTALERAKLQAIADEFGTVVSESSTLLTNNRNGEARTDFFSAGNTEVKGEWIETTREPEYSITYDQGSLVVTVIVEGRIREITTAQIDLEAEVLCNGTDLKFARTDFRSGDDMYLYFRSPVDGYLTVYLLDEATQTVYCLLPYSQSPDAAMPISHDVPYILFSAAHAGDNAHLVDEYTMTCGSSAERNTLYAVFSPNEFTKANADSKAELLPRELSFEKFQKWLAKGRSRDREMTVKKMEIVIKGK